MSAEGGEEGDGKGGEKGGAKGKAKSESKAVYKHLCPYGCGKECDDLDQLRGHINASHIRGARDGASATPGGDTPAKGGDAPTPIADERASLEQFILECWPRGKDKVPGVLRLVEMRGWTDLAALNEALVLAGCGPGETKLILTNWRVRLQRAGQPVGDVPTAAPAASDQRPVEDLTDEDVEREYKRLELARARKMYRDQVLKDDSGGGGAVDKLAAEFRAFREESAKKEVEERHARELADLKREIAAKAAPPANMVRRRIAAVDPATGRAVTDEDGQPVYNTIEEPWQPQTPKEAEKDSELLKAVTKLVEARSSPESDPRLASMEAEMKALRAQAEDKKLEEVVNRATGPLYEMIQKQNTERGVADMFEQRLAKMGLTGGQNPQAQADLEVIKGGVEFAKEAIKRGEHRMNALERAVSPVLQGVGKTLEKELVGPPSEDQRLRDAAAAGEAAGGPPPDLPPESGGSSDEHPRPPGPETPPTRPAKVTEL